MQQTALKTRCTGARAGSDRPQDALYWCSSEDSVWGQNRIGTKSTACKRPPSRRVVLVLERGFGLGPEWDRNNKYGVIPQRIACKRPPSRRVVLVLERGFGLGPEWDRNNKYGPPSKHVVLVLERGGLWGRNGKKLLKSPIPSSKPLLVAALVWRRISGWSIPERIAQEKPPSGRIVLVLERGFDLSEWDGNKKYGAIPQRMAQRRSSSGPAVLVLERGFDLGPEWDRNNKYGAFPQRIAIKKLPSRRVVLVLERGFGLGPEGDRNKKYGGIPQRIAPKRPPPRHVVLVLERGFDLGSEWDRNKKYGAFPQRIAKKRPPSRRVVLVLERGFGLGPEGDRNKKYRAIPQRIAQQRPPSRRVVLMLERGFGLGPKWDRNNKYGAIQQRIASKQPPSRRVVLVLERGSGFGQECERTEKYASLGTKCVGSLEAVLTSDTQEDGFRTKKARRSGLLCKEVREKSWGDHEVTEMGAVQMLSEKGDGFRWLKNGGFIGSLRAEIKAKRRRSDKPRVKKSKIKDTQGEDQRVDTLSAAEREASETLASMRHLRPVDSERQRMTPEVIPRAPTLSPLYDYEGDCQRGYRDPGTMESSDEETDYPVGVRNGANTVEFPGAYPKSRRIKMVNPSPITQVVEFSGEPRQRLRFDTPELSRSPSPVLGGLGPRMPSVYEKLDEHMRRAR
ncbi:hypothetical protein B0H16DRAFT_1461416 [Mycena metata]|uniref:Uncharacterized protein n=1 Tax=Mycena metata TaxID=1033252 RepID=A0AAD7IU49_9AGAR|nr:hypothetical protein B0H16DRAFT_1461416 [Mycena metata]